MASYADHGHDHAHEDEDDESGSLLEPVAVLRLLLQFLSAGSDSGDLEVRERAGTFIWDLSAEAEHCALLARHLGAFVELLSSARTPPRFRELAVGTLANVAAHEACVLSNESIREIVAASYAEAADPGLLTEAARLLHVAVTRLASSRYRAAGDGGAPGPPTAASNLGDAWADTVASLSGKTLFVLRNSLDAPLLARVFELCFAVRFLVDAEGRGDVFATHCEGDALLDAAVAALGAPDTVESLSGVLVDGGSSGLDSALRVVELCSLRDAERSLHGSKAHGDAAIRRRALDCLARVLSSAERSDTERLTAVVALANFAPTRAELLAAPVAGLADAIRRALDAALADLDGETASAHAAIHLYAALAPSDVAPAARAAFERAKRAGLDVPDALLG